MKCPLFAQVNWCKPFQELHQKSTVTGMQTCCLLVGSGVGVSPPLSTAGDWAAVWHHVLMQSAEASERDYRGGARDDCVPTESHWVLLMYVRRVPERDEQIVRERSADIRETPVRAAWEEGHGWMNKHLMRRTEGMKIEKELETTDEKGNVTPNNQIKTESWKEKERRRKRVRNAAICSDSRLTHCSTSFITLAPSRPTTQCLFWFIP